MKRVILSMLIVIMVFPLFSQGQWQSISKQQPVEFSPTLISSGNGESVVEFSLEGFYLTDVNAPRANSKIVSVSRTAAISEAGAPDLRQLTAALIIPDQANMEIEVLETEYYDIPNIEIAPSKGDFPRSIDPATVPYVYGPAYQQDAWYPGKLAELADPHIHRDFRGVVAITYPFQYNPATKVLRVYNKIVVKVKESSSTAAPYNPLYRNKALTSIVEDFHYMYQDRYLNYSPDKYTAPVERGNILVISHPDFINAMTPYVRWKNIIGFPTEIVSVATIGNTVANIKNYVTNYYNTNGLAYLLLVGDYAQITSHSYGSYSGSNQTSDNYYGDISGNDLYLEVVVGRFSATTTTHVNTQVTKVLDYEKATGMATNWQYNGLGLARNEGAGMGHDGGEADYVHMDNIRTRLLAYNYTTVYREYDGNVPGLTNTTATQISTRINDGVSIINFCNHGNETGWSVGSYSNTHVNALTNVKKLPFVWSVACLVGKFAYTSGDCFAETWLKATHNSTGEPTGALAFYGSTVNQPWHPPMDAQDEFTRVLCELLTGKIRRTYGSISASGTMHMLDLGPTNSDRLVTARTWTIFGDPSVMVRTDTPLSMTVTHPASLGNGATSMTVNCNVNDAFVTLTKNYQIIGTGTISGGSVNITFPAVYAGDTVHVAVTAYNRIPYEADVPVLNPTSPLDLEAYAIIDPADVINCPGITVTPQVVIRNMGTTTVTSCTIYYQINSNPEVAYSWTGSLPTLMLDTVTLPVFTSVLGNHTFRFRTDAPNGGSDGDPTNDDNDKTFDVQNNIVSADFSANFTEFCDNPAIVQFTNTSQHADSYSWNFGDGNFSSDENPTHEYLNLGTYTVTLIADAGACGNDTRTYTDMIQVGAAAPVAADQENCGPASFTLNATGNGNIVWYSDAAGTSQVGTGSSYVTPVISNTTTYYLSTTILDILFGGRLDNSGTGGYFTTAGYPHGLVFNCTAPTTLKTVKVYADGAGDRVISLEDSGGSVLESATINIPDGESRITLNFNIPVGNGLKLMGPGAPYLFRNGATGMIIGYPIAAGNNISIIESTAVGAEPNYYYYFYDWEVEEVCESALNEVTAFVLETPSAAFTSNATGSTVDFTNSSTGGNLSYSWDFGDGNNSTDENPSHTYGSNGLFTVTLTVTNSCGSDVFTQQIDLTTVGIDEFAGDFVIFPNPATEMCLVSCNEIISVLSITDVQGKLIQTYYPQTNEFSFDVSNLAQGIYYLRIISNENTMVKQLQVK